MSLYYIVCVVYLYACMLPKIYNMSEVTYFVVEPYIL